jgi:hypothetical protein
MVMIITSPTVNIVATKRHHESDGNGDRDRGWQIFVHRRPGVTFMGNHLKRTQPTPMYDCILGAAVDDYGVWDGFTSDLSVGVGWNRLKVAMESLIGECAPRD